MPGEPSKPHRPETIINYAAPAKRKSTNDLVGTVYHELKGLANRMMANERAGHTLQATALVHEAYVRLTDQDALKWDSKAHFYGAAALAMRRILVERARAKAAHKRGGSRKRLDIDEIDLATADDSVDWLALDEAMTELQKHDGALHEVVMLRFFAGLSVEETAEAIEKSDRTVKRMWSDAREWLNAYLGKAPA
jgi:RNA polymerase sigma factor (TIGR02999 family)